MGAAQGVGDEGAFEGFDGLGERARAFLDGVAERRCAALDAEHAAVGDVAQFAYVAGPAVANELACAGRVAFGDRAPVAGRRLQQEVLEEQRDVLAPFAQRRQGGGGDAQTVVAR